MFHVEHFRGALFHVEHKLSRSTWNSTLFHSPEEDPRNSTARSLHLEYLESVFRCGSRGPGDQDGPPGTSVTRPNGGDGGFAADSPSYHRIKPFRKILILLDEILGSTLEHADIG